MVEVQTPRTVRDRYRTTTCVGTSKYFGIKPINYAARESVLTVIFLIPHEEEAGQIPGQEYLGMPVRRANYHQELYMKYCSEPGTVNCDSLIPILMTASI